MDVDSAYTEGDWIVHTHYGVGQIAAIEAKRISGQKTEYFRVETTNGTYWIPLDQIDGDCVRPIASSTEIEEALSTLWRQPKAMSSNHLARKNRIKRVRKKNKPQSIARLIRDLRAKRREKGILNQDERHAFEALKKRFAEECAIVSGTGTDQVLSKLDRLLQQQPAAEK